MIVLIILAIVCFVVFGQAKRPRKMSKGGPIVVRGCRNPMVYDIMEENYADFKAKLIEDAKNGVIYRRSKTINLKDFLDKKNPPEYEDFPASEALKEFMEYEANGYQ